nr:MAG TPA: hypothetical protein [Caudoviricetes sp.]
MRLFFFFIILGVYGKSLRYRDSPDLRRLLFFLARTC